jgi:hypothetical protein
MRGIRGQNTNTLVRAWARALLCGAAADVQLRIDRPIYMISLCSFVLKGIMAIIDYPLLTSPIIFDRCFFVLVVEQHRRGKGSSGICRQKDGWSSPHQSS